VLGELLERTPAAFGKLLILERKYQFWRKDKDIAVALIPAEITAIGTEKSSMWYKEEAEGRAQPP
jgi:hypothetical protein